MSKIVINDNKTLLAHLNEENKEVGYSSYNCRKKEECLFGGKCFIESILYQVNISTNEGKLNRKDYKGISLNWKITYYNQ